MNIEDKEDIELSKSVSDIEEALTVNAEHGDDAHSQKQEK